MSIVITFDSKIDVIIFERACRDNDLPGRITPVPRAISASCGSCWKAPSEFEDEIMDMAEKENLKWDELYEIDF